MQTTAVLLVACAAKAKKHLVLVRTCLSAVFLMMPRCSAVLEMRVVLPPSLPFSASAQRTRWASSRQSYSHRGGCYSRWSDMGPKCMPGARGEGCEAAHTLLQLASHCRDREGSLMQSP